MAVSASKRRPKVKNLPVELVSFVGRRHELAEAKRVLSGARCLTLTGVGGIGKTRLALRLASAVRRGFDDGVCLVELASLKDPELLADTVAAALGIRESQSAPSSAALVVDYWRDRRLLLVLATCEPLLDACAEFALELLRAAPGLRILVTSREPLRIDGESVLQVPPLSMPDLDSPPPLEALGQYEAVRLFIDRATAVLPSFTLTAENSVAVTQLCHRLDGIPLCIELAAARLPVLSAEQLLARLDDRFRVLTAGVRTALPRQQTLRASIDWSFSLCTEDEQALWTRASIFAGGFELEAAEEVCSGGGLDRDAVLDLLTRLVDKSVIIRDRHGPHTRYRILESVREYGLEKLSERGGAEEVGRRHRVWYACLARQLSAEWFGDKQVELFTQLYRDHANIRAALDYCLADAEGPQTGQRIAADLLYYWVATGAITEGRRWLGRLLDNDVPATSARVHVLCVASRLAVLQSDFDGAAPLLDEARSLGQRLECSSGLAHVAYVSGLAAFLRADLPRAADFLEEARTRFSVLDDQAGVANSLIYLAATLSRLGQASRAISLHEEVLAMSEVRGERWFQSWALWALGIELFRQGELSRAIISEQESIRLKDSFNDQLGIALCVEALAWTAVTHGEADKGAQLLGAAASIFDNVGARLFEHLTPQHDQSEAAAREKLGQAAFDRAYQAGAAFSLDRSVRYALGKEQATKSRTGRVDHREPVSLTRRESEVAGLVAQGLTNREIAEKLVISQRTAEAHVEHILSKLGFTSRSRVAAWVAEHH